MSENTQHAWEKYPAALPVDTILAGEYIIKNVLGQGGFGITYLAEEYRTNAKVAVKEFFPETMAMRSTPSLEVRTYTDERLDNFRFGMNSFLAEAKVLAQFQGNPHIVGVQKYFEENGTAYFVMEYIEGIDFKTYIKQNGGKLVWEEVWKIMSPVMDALDAVHQKGMVHRDVTPDNIFLSKDGTVKLLDFGSARYSLGDRSRSLDVVLKPGYAPKEQYTRRGKQGAFTDVYSVAACFYAALSGYLPPESLDRMEEDNLVLLSARGVRLDQTAEDAIIKALEVRAGDRYQTMAEFKQAILAQKTQQASEELSAPEALPVSYVDEGIPSGEEMLISELDDNKEAELSAAQDNKVKKHFRFRNVIAAIAVAVIAAGIGIGLHLYRNGWHTREYDNGVYSGDFENGDMHGYGTFIYSNGDTYSGSWRYGEKSGQGKYVYADGSVYDGEWSIDKKNGQGKCTYANGDVYDGEWNYDTKSGQGKYTYANGDWYEGEFKGNEFVNGQGRETHTNGGWYEGEFQEGKFVSGQGRELIADGWYEGEYKDGVMNGWGILVYTEDNARESFEGNWVDGEQSGEGKLIWKDGAVYEGEFKDGMRNGHGIETYASGSVYEGEFKDGMKNGYGISTYLDGDMYEGEFRDGNRNGHGKYTWSSGSVYEGEFKDGKSNGYGIKIYAAESKYESYEGNWVDDERSGHGTLKWKVGDKWEGEFRDDTPNGDGTYTWADGRTKKITYKDGKPMN